MKVCLPVLMAVTSARVGTLSAEILEFEDEAAFQAALLEMGYAPLVEDFEGAAWDDYRTIDPFDPQSAPEVTSQGVTWSGNDEISTNTNWGRNGTWGIFTIFGGTWTPDTLAGVSEFPMFGVGGWVNSNPDFGADIGIVIRGQVVAERQIGTGHQFIGVIDTCGFFSFEFIDIEQQTAWGADDFTIAIGGELEDCNNNGLCDAEDIAVGTSEDCNGNAIPDECDLADGASEDCNTNVTPDECEVVAPMIFASGELSPIGSESPQSFTIPSAPPALADVTLSFEAYANLGGGGDHIDVTINGTSVGTIFDGTGTDCPEGVPDGDQLMVGAAMFNDAVDGGDAVIEMNPSSGVDPLDCDFPTTIAVEVTIPAPSDADLNQNGIPDECEGCEGDANGDGAVDPLDSGYVLARFGCAVGTGNAECDAADGNGDGAVDPLDVGFILARFGSCQ